MRIYGELSGAGKCFFAHGSNHSCGVITLDQDLDFEDESCLYDPVGRFIILNATWQGVKHVFANIYAPNKVRVSAYRVCAADVTNLLAAMLED